MHRDLLPELTPEEIDRRTVGRIRLRSLIRLARENRRILLLKISLATLKSAPIKVILGLEKELARVRSSLVTYETLMDETKEGLGERLNTRPGELGDSLWAPLRGPEDCCGIPGCPQARRAA